jgi:hypothetical protein
MPRSFHALDLVQLPRLDSTAAQTLGTEVLAAARGKTLPASVSEALQDLTLAHRALQAASAQRLAALPSTDPARTKAADTALDASWSALFDLLNGWSKLPDHELGALASGLVARLFPDGLKFVLMAYKLQWAESNTRLLLVKEHKLESELERLGALPLLKRLRDAHKEYGEALGITNVSKVEPATATLRETLSEFCDALRHYIVRVAATVHRNDEKSAAFAQTLLAAVERWSLPGSQTTKPATDTDATPGTTTPVTPPAVGA